MPVCTLERHLPFSAEQMFDLVIDVEHYQDFMPFEFCARIIERGTEAMRTSQTLRIGPIPFKFESRTTFCRPEWLRVISTSSPFKYFSIAWTFTRRGQECAIRAHVECTADSLLLTALLTPWMEPFTHSLIFAFERRATEIYART